MVPNRSISARAVASEILGIPLNAVTPGGGRDRRFARASPLLPDCEAVKPQRRVVGIASANDGNPEIGDREQATPNRMRMAGSLIEVAALDEQKRQDRCISNPPNLRPEPTARERTMEIRDGLALDERTALDAVVAGRQWLDHDASTKPLQTRRHAAALLEHVRRDDELRMERFCAALSQLSSGAASRSRSRASLSKRISVRARRESSSASRRTIERATELLPPCRSRSASAASASDTPNSHARRTAASAGSASPSSHRSGVMRRIWRAISRGSPSSSASETQLRQA
jgi:hypothetical protein